MNVGGFQLVGPMNFKVKNTRVPKRGQGMAVDFSSKMAVSL